MPPNQEHVPAKVSVGWVGKDLGMGWGLAELLHVELQVAVSQGALASGVGLRCAPPLLIQPPPLSLLSQ